LGIVESNEPAHPVNPPYPVDIGLLRAYAVALLNEVLFRSEPKA
jgi:hypothetical protein